MFKAINYEGFSEDGKLFFEESILIVSSMYGLVKPLDHIGNYKLPIEAKGCIKFWQPIITKTLSQVDSDIIISFLPESYLKVIDIKKLKKPFIKVNFLTLKNGKEMKMAHGSKKVKGEYIRNICEKQLSDFNTF